MNKSGGEETMDKEPKKNIRIKNCFKGKSVTVTSTCGGARHFIEEGKTQEIPHQLHNNQTLTFQAVDKNSIKIHSYIKIKPFKEGYQSLQINYDYEKRVWQVRAPGEPPQEDAIQVDVNVEIGDDND